MFDDCSFYMAPLQGYTNPIYRYAHSQVYKGVSKYFTPFIEEGERFDKQVGNELNQKFTKGINVVPQLVTRSPNFLMSFAERMIALGFEEININMGCPFPMLIKRGLGGGILGDHKLIDNMLSQFFKAQLPLALSIKMRSGITCFDEGKSVLEVLNRYNISEIIFHPRLVNQKYKGSIHFHHFKWFYENTDHRLCANGNINSFEDYSVFRREYPNLNTFMIGRGLLANPNLVNELQKGLGNGSYVRLLQFHQLYYNLLLEHCIDWNQAFNYLQSFWYYKLNMSVEKKRFYRRLKKHNKPELYASWLNELMNEFKTY